MRTEDNIDVGQLVDLTRSDLMQDIYSKVIQVAQTTSNVLLIGEQGSGKKFASRIIYNQSNCNGPFHTYFCSAIEQSIFNRNFQGYLSIDQHQVEIHHKATEEAKGGILFFDNFSELPVKDQIHISEVISDDQNTLNPHHTQSENQNFRVIISIQKSRFKTLAAREYWQHIVNCLNPISIWIPPLRAHREDIYPLIEYFLHCYRCENNIPSRIQISLRALYKCISYHWPGNIRQLKNTITNAIIQAQDGNIKTKNLPFSISWDEWTNSECIPTERMKSFQNAQEHLLADLFGKENSFNLNISTPQGVERRLRNKID